MGACSPISRLRTLQEVVQFRLMTINILFLGFSALFEISLRMALSDV